MTDQATPTSPAGLRARLESLAEPRYRDFAARLLPGETRLLGVRLPTLRALAKKLARGGALHLPTAEEASVEELMLRGMVIGYARGVSLQERLAALESFVPLISNWSVCDSCCATYTFARKERENVWEWLSSYLGSAQEYTARFGVVMLLQHYKQETAWATRVANALPHVHATDYYAEMAVAWCACELCLLYPELREGLLEQLRPSVRRLTMRKLRESRRG